MPISVTDLGSNNHIDIEPKVLTEVSGTIVFRGSNNRVHLATPFVAHAVQFDFGDGCSLAIEPNCHAGILGVHMAERGTVVIGAGSSFNGQTRLLLHEPGRIDIGAGCLFGPDVDVTVSDMHAILDCSTGERINLARDVVIGDRVWIGIGTFIGKGALLGAGSVVGARTFVSGEVRPNTIVAGNPARLLRENATWRFAL